MAKDFSPGGRGYHLVEKVQRELDLFYKIAGGRARPIEEDLARRTDSRL
jgi:hypothetical protein